MLFIKRKNNQQGFVLVVALVILAVLTLIGVSSMKRANMELKSTANARQHQVAFNAIQSVLEFNVSENSPFDFQPGDLTAVQSDSTTLISNSMTYAGCNVGIGSSLEGSGFSYNFFNIQSSGGKVSGAATSTQTQGVRYPSASCDPTLTPLTP